MSKLNNVVITSKGLDKIFEEESITITNNKFENLQIASNRPKINKRFLLNTIVNNMQHNKIKSEKCRRFQETNPTKKPNLVQLAAFLRKGMKQTCETST